MDPEDIQDNSDSSDEDYVPDKKEENVSEVESDGEPEYDLSDGEHVGRTKKRTKHTTKSRKKRKQLQEELKEDNEVKQAVEEEKKKTDDDVWADFMKDTGFQSKKDLLSSSVKSAPVKAESDKSGDKKPRTEEKKTETVKITQVFKFAGEEVAVEKEVAKNSPEARLSNKSNTEPTKPFNNRSGLSGILSQLGKKPKITTLEKSKLDWDRFKKEENLEEELQTHNKGKDGYLERQDFLQRADLRRFEIEKEIRTIERNKRMNNI